MCAAFRLALGHKITLRQQLSAVLLQKPLDRSGTGLVWSRVDVTDPFCHAVNSRPSFLTKARKITFADRPRQSKRDMVCSGPVTRRGVDQIANLVYAKKA